MIIRIFVILYTTLILYYPISGQSSSVKSKAAEYITNQQGVFSSLTIGANDLYISSSHTSKVSNVHHIYFQQTIDGIDILNAVGTVHLNQNEDIVHASSRFINTSTFSKQSGLSLTALDAIDQVADYYRLPIKGQTRLLSQEGGSDERRTYINKSFSNSDIPTKLVYVRHDGILVLTWEIFLDKPDDGFMWMVFINAQTGAVQKTTSLTTSCNFGHDTECSDQHSLKHLKPSSRNSSYSFAANSYTVFPIPLEAPNEGPTSDVVEPWNNALNASQFGWHDTDGIAGAEFTITRGNNVWAQEDVDGNNATVGVSPDGGPMLMFNFPIDITMPPGTYLDGATTNLFYMNNIMHDVTYQYGFDEVSGNFQFNNYGKGGAELDEVIADAQDGSGTNNANFSTPPDGFNPRMQMFQWSPSIGSAIIEVTAPGNVVGTYSSSKANFGPQVSSISGAAVFADAAIACDTMPITNGAELNGKIAMIDRGGCTFVEKVTNAQLAGAIGVIVCNNIPGGGVISMGGTDFGITIPAAMISYEDCQLLRVEVDNGLTINMDLIDQVNTDSDLDNGIIAHEYGHGISNRLTGGPGQSGCLPRDSEQMGEGWSDYFGLMFQLKPGDMGTDRNGIGTYVQGDIPTGKGIRQYPYSTDMTINPHTYNDVKDQWFTNQNGDQEVSPHGVGSIWNAMLWDMTWNLIEKYGYEPDIYATTMGNGLAMKLVMEGMKLQPCSPGFVDGRDAILMADTTMNGGENACEIWRAFARRGLGVGANQGSPFSIYDGTPSFLRPEGCFDELIEPCTDETLAYDNESIPDGTDKRVNTTITIIDSDVLAGTDVMLRANQTIEIDPLFEVAETGELFLKIIPCTETPARKAPKSEYKGPVGIGFPGQ